MIPNEIREFIKENSILMENKTQWDDTDPYSKVLLSTHINNGVYDLDFHNNLSDDNLIILEYGEPTSNVHSVSGTFIFSACVFSSNGKLVFKSLKYSDNNESHEFNNIKELEGILESYGMLNDN